MPKITPTITNPGLNRILATCVSGFFGLTFWGMMAFSMSAGDRNPGWLKTITTGPSVILILLIVAAVVGILVQNSLWGTFEASIQEKVVRRGDEFHFHIEQPVRRRTQVKKVRVFLIYRETILIHHPSDDKGSHTEKQIFDRLIDSSEQPGGFFEKGEVLTGTHKLRVPTRLLSARHPFRYRNPDSNTPGWVIKVRLDLTWGRVDWREFLLKTDFDPLQPTTGLPTELTNDMYDLFCSRVPWFQRPGAGLVWRNAVPHGLWGVKQNLPPAPSFLVLERRDRSELETVKAKLEKVGAVLEIRPSV